MIFRKLFAVIFIAFGTFLLVNSFNITGFVIFEEINQKQSTFKGIILIFFGILLLKSYSNTLEEENEISQSNNFKSRRGLRAHNREAHYAARRHFMEQYGRIPDKQELKEYTRKMHETHDLSYIVEERKHHKKSA